MPPVPSPKVTLTAAPPLKEEKVKVLPETPPAAAARLAVNAVPVPVEPVRPSEDSALPVPVIVRSEFAPVEMCSEPATSEEAVWPLAVPGSQHPMAMVAVCTPVARSIAFRMSATVPLFR